MNVQINKLVKSLLQKESLDQCSVSELQQFADRHPYFGAAQLLLTKKLQTENDSKYNEQLQKTFLFFHNPLWVEQLLNESGNATIEKSQPSETAPVNFPEAIQDINTLNEKNNTDIEISNNEPVLDIPTLKSEPAETGKEELLFEPFHTVDYFASQGIKFRDEEKPKDKFGQQLKSFTDWLKTMKRLTVSDTNENADSKSELSAVLENKVEQLAEVSIANREVFTQAMAEVWEKQGNPVKAVEIYSKLSLLDPSKSVYFAAKIEELKKKI
jgi:hypothetical protein